MKPILFLVVVVLAAGYGQCFISQAPTDTVDPQATQLADEIEDILPDGWRCIHVGVDSAPRRWSGKTIAVTVEFQHDSLKFFGDGTSPASFRLWRTPGDYAGTLLPSQMPQPGGAWILGISKNHRWFIEGLLPEDEHWKPIRATILTRFAVAPPE